MDRGMDIRPLENGFGSEIWGINLTKTDGALQRELRAALLRYQVLIIREQNLSASQQLAFSKGWGPLDIHVQVKDQHPDHEEVIVLTTKMKDGKYIGAPHAGDYWHSDLSYVETPTFCTILHAIEVAEEGGDTAFANMYRAYELLPEKTKNRIKNLRARHSYDRNINPRVAVPDTHAAVAKERYSDRSPPPAVHPVVRTHPETGKKALYVTERFTLGIEEMDPELSEFLLQELFEVASQPSNIYRHKWRKGDLVIWDNRCLMHIACGGVPKGQIRHMHRTIVRGDKPY